MARAHRALAALSVTAAAVAATTAARVPPRSGGSLSGVAAVRAFGLQNVTGTYTRFTEFGANANYACASQVVMNSNPILDAARTTYTVPHATITADQVPCSSNSTLDVLPSATLSKEVLMGDLGFLTVPGLTDQIVDSLFRNTRGFLLGLERDDRTCGASVLPGGTAVIFVHEETNVQLLDNLTLPGGAGVSYMGVVVPDKACIYVRAAEDRNPAVTGGNPPNNVNTGEGGDGDGGATPVPVVVAEPEEEDSCFPATASVRLADGSSKTMGELGVGDAIHVGDDAPSDVYAFSHKLTDQEAPYVAITTTSGEAAASPLLLSPSHYLYVFGELAAASEVRVGDELTGADGEALTVASVRRVTRRGVYAPHTLHGDLLVNGVRVSSYTQAVHPGVAHALLAPLRLAYRLGVKDPAGSWLYAGRPAGVVAALLPRGF